MAKYPVNDLHVRTFRSQEEFKSLEEDWNRLYLKDRHAHIFVSRIWLNNWLLLTKLKWTILGVQSESTEEFIGFLILTTHEVRLGKIILRKVVSIGPKPFSYYSGFLCDTEYEKTVILLFSKFITSELKWDKLNVSGLAGHRIDFFLQDIDQGKFKVERSDDMPGIVISLPESYDSYLKDIIGRSTLKSLKKHKVRLYSDYCIRLTEMNSATAHSDIEVLLELWQTKWGGQENVKMNKAIWLNLFEAGMFNINILWNDKIPIAAQALFFDHDKKSVYAYITGYNASYAMYSPGNLIGMISIESAIENGYHFYDFIIGDDDYKKRLGGQMKILKKASVVNYSLKSRTVQKFMVLVKKAKQSLSMKKYK